MPQCVRARFTRGLPRSAGTCSEHVWTKEGRGLEAGGWGAGRAAADSVAAQASAGAWPATHLQLLKDFLLGLELFIWLALLVALHEHSLTGSRACRRVQRLNLAVYPLSKKTKGTRKE